MTIPKQENNCSIKIRRTRSRPGTGSRWWRWYP